jgi:hypothetical protein
VSDTTKSTSDGDKAKRIKDKISASQERSRGKAAPRKAAKADGKASTQARTARRRSPTDQRSFLDRALDDHPLALLAGSVVLGAIAASLVPASLTRKFGSRMLGLAAFAGEMGSLYGGKALNASAKAARAGQDRLEDLGETTADYGSDAREKAIELGTLAARRAIELAQEAASNAREASGGAFKRIAQLSDRVRH